MIGFVIGFIAGSICEKAFGIVEKVYTLINKAIGK